MRAKLPKKWCVKGDRQEVIDYSNIHGMYPKYKLCNSHLHHYPPSQGCTTGSVVEKGYVEITFEEFEHFVLRKNQTYEIF